MEGSRPLRDGQTLQNAGEDAAKRQAEHEERETRRLAEADRKLEDLQIVNIFSLLKEVTVRGLQAKCLFLTNHQARSLDLRNMSKFIMAMDLDPKPKLVINFFEAFASLGHEPRGRMPRGDAAEVKPFVE